MKQSSILLIGAGGHARSCIDVIEQERCYPIAGLVGLPEEVGSRVFGYPILGTDEDLQKLLNTFDKAIVVVGQIKSPELRIKFFNKLLHFNCDLPTIVSPRAYVSPHARLGAGTIVMHGAVVNAGAIVGRNCIINSQALVEHDVTIGDHCHIATMAVINGDVQIGAGSFIGSNAVVRQGIMIGERSFIGMNQRVIFDCEFGLHLSGLKEL